MKLVNTRDIRRSLDSESAELDDFFDSKAEIAGPCRMIRIRPEDDKITFLLDGSELMCQSLKKLGFSDGVPKDELDRMLALWRDGRMAELRSRLGLKALKRKAGR